MLMKQLFFFLSLVLCLHTTINAQTAASRGDELMKQAQNSLQQKEYIKARYLFLQAYNAFAGKEEYVKAIECGVQVSSLYHRENYYKEAFEHCRTMDQLVTVGEQKQNKTFPELRFLINRERIQMHISLKRSAPAKDILNRLEENAKAARNDSVNENLLYIQANYYYTFGMPAQGDACFQKLINQYNQQKNYSKVDVCYKKLIDIARKANNSTLVVHTYDKYIAWADSVKALAALDELNMLKVKYDGSLQVIQEKDNFLSKKQYLIIGLCVLLAIFAAVLVLGIIVLLRFILLTRKQKKTIQVINEHNELKTQFIQNISAQIKPTLDTLDASLPGVQALHDFAEHIQTLSDLETTLSETYEMIPVQVAPFCESIMDKIKENLKPNMTAVVNAPKMSVKANPEQLEFVLLHLLNNAAIYTPEYGRISLDFKKRGAHTYQFIVTDTGTGIPVEVQEELFKPFAGVKDLTQGDGLGLPICSLIATKMNGNLSLDTNYTKGSRFILELHS